MTDISILMTDLEPLFITPHGMRRRAERKMTLRELSIAISHGKKEQAVYGPNGEVRWKFTFAGVVVVTVYETTKILTSWILSGYGIEIPKAVISQARLKEHKNSVERLKEMSLWTSHTVIIVDQSGSMRKMDADKDFTYSDLVWSTLAMSFIADKLKNGERKDTDVFSLVSMRDTASVLLRYKPFDWLLYNNVVELFRTHAPSGPGNYIPAMYIAQSLLNYNNYGGCALMLVFLSDGRPSDQLKGVQTTPNSYSAVIKDRIGRIASRIGNRLTVGAIPLGKAQDDEFATLKALTEGAKEHGCQSFFLMPTLSANVLSTAMTALSSTLTSTVVEMGHQQCRPFRKEPVSNVGGSEITGQIDRVDMRTYERNIVEYVMLRSLRREVRRGKRVHASIVRTLWKPGEGWRPCRCEVLFHAKTAAGVAIKKAWFGEGRERLVKEFREVNAEGFFDGPPLVAKDTKYLRHTRTSVVDEDRQFHKVFCKSQIKSQKDAGLFNEQLSKIQQYDPLSTPLYRVPGLLCLYDDASKIL